MILNDLERRNSPNRCVISQNSVDFGADYVKVVEDTPYFLRQKSSLKNLVLSDISFMAILAGDSVRFVKKTVGSRTPKTRESRRRRHWGGMGCGEGLCLLPRKFLIFFHFKIVHSDPFSYTNILRFYLQSNAWKGTSSWYSWRLTVIQIWKRQVFINLVNLYQSSQSLATRIGLGFTATVGRCYRPKIFYTLNHKKRDILFLTITLANLRRFL